MSNRLWEVPSSHALDCYLQPLPAFVSEHLSELHMGYMWVALVLDQLLTLLEAGEIDRAMELVASELEGIRMALRSH